MARLANIANLGFQPLPAGMADLIATFIGRPSYPVRIYDSCAGQGEAIGTIAQILGIGPDQMYLNELHDQRAEACRQYATHVTACDTLKSLQASCYFAQLGYENPPFDYDGKEEGGGRLEIKFFRRSTEEGHWLQPGGLKIIVSPQDILARHEVAAHLARCYDDIRIFALPPECRRYREAVFFGVMRERFRCGVELRQATREMEQLLAEDLPILSAQAEPLYTLPEPLQIRKITWRDGSKGTPRMAQQDVVQSGGAWESKAHLRARASLSKKHLLPVFPPNPQNAALAIAGGVINGTEVEFGGATHILKGSTVDQVITWQEEKETDRSLVKAKHRVTRRVPRVVTVSKCGKGIIRQFNGDQGMRKLMELPNMAQALLDAYENAAPPRYQLDMAPDVAAVLGGIKPANGRSLPGYKPGLLPMQQHVVAGVVRALTTPDPSWDGQTPQGVIVAAEMGCGKTSMGLSTAEVLYQLRDTYKKFLQRRRRGPKGQERRAFTVLVSAPNHLIGDKAMVQAFRDGKTHELPPWFEEWSNMLPQWHCAILESPFDAGAFFRGAIRDPNTPRVGFIANTKLSLGSGVVVGAEDNFRPMHERHAVRFMAHAETEANELVELRKQQRRAAQTQAEASATADNSADDDESATKTPTGISPRTARRDAICIPPRYISRYVKRDDATSFPVYQTRSVVRVGMCCPRCGRRQLSRGKIVRPLSYQELKKQGPAKLKCEWCHEKLAQMDRERDNVLDRSLQVFAVQTEVGHTPTAPRRVVPRTQFAAEQVDVHASPRCRWFGSDRQPIVEAFPATKTVIIGEEPVLDEHGQPMVYRDADSNPVLAEDGTPVQIVRVLKKEVPLLDDNQQPIMEYRPVVTFEEASGAAIPWGKRPQSNPRYALGKYIRRRFAGAIDLYIADEVHECKAGTSDIGRAFGALITASAMTLGLTGTLYGGYASDVYALLLRLGNKPVLETYGWDNQAQFVREAGVVDEITNEILTRNEAGHFSGEPRIEIRVQERPGITAYLASIIQNTSIQVLLKHMGFNLVDYSEDLVVLNMPGDVGSLYRRLEQRGKEIIAFGGNDALSSYLQSTLTYPYAPWQPKKIHSKRKGESYTTVPLPANRVLPHHEWLAQYAANQINQGRRVLVYCEHTMRDDILADVAAKITELAREKHGANLKVGILRSTTVKPGQRRLWFAEREADGTNVVLCNPRLVKTGLNLIGWPSIVVLEPVYSLFTLFQAKRRAFRPTQTVDCEVTYVCYADTMSERAIGVIAKKAAAANILSGDDLSGGLCEIEPSMSLLQELAKAVTNGDADAMNENVRAMLQEGAQAMRADMMRGASDLIGISLADGMTVEDLLAAQVDESAHPHAEVVLLSMPEQRPVHAQQPGKKLSMLELYERHQAAKTSNRRKKPAPSDQQSFADLGLFA